MSRHLMAKFRRVAVDDDGFHFDWQPSDLRSHGVRANLENGDWLHVTRNSQAHRGQPDIWEYTLYGPQIIKDGPDPNVHLETDMSHWSGNSRTGSPPFKAQVLGQAVGVNGFESDHEAKKAAEEHYLSIADSRRGQTPPARDYSDLDSPSVDFNDFDYGDIFGGDK